MRPTAKRIDVRTTIGDILPYRHHVTHGWDKYPAKMVPHLARYAIECVSTKRDIVLDPFCGCGTVQIESAASGQAVHRGGCQPTGSLVGQGQVSHL